MLALLMNRLAVRSNCTPGFSLKAISSTTFSNGPVQLAGGVNWKFFCVSEKKAKVKLAKSGTTHGCSCGRVTTGSAVTSIGEPTWRFVLWANVLNEVQLTKRATETSE